MNNENWIVADQMMFRAELSNCANLRHLNILRLCVWRPLVDIMFDFLIIAATVVLVVEFWTWFAPVAVLVIANRQRSLGNILHDAGHHNIHRSRWINDTLASLLVAPLMFIDLVAYRESHFKHHLQLGSAKDPDKLQRIVGGSWIRHYLTNLFSQALWWRSLGGHLCAAGLGYSSRLYILLWWGGVCAVIGMLAGVANLGTFLMLWIVARATSFHAITTFREMCDHYGLEVGGIFSFTRDIQKNSLWCWFIHPRNNGYHLTHHLLPAVPYYKLPSAQVLFAKTKIYWERGHICDSYFFGRCPAVSCWCQQKHEV